MNKSVSKKLTKNEGGMRCEGNFRKHSVPGNPLVSVVTVCLNSKSHLELAIQSVLGQTYKNIEYIIVDGGSNDGTIEIIKKFDTHIAYWVSEPDKGIFDAMNKGIGFSSGELIGIVNSDDWYNDKTVEWVVNASLLESAADIFHGDIIKVVGKGQYERIAGSEKFLFGNRELSVFHPTCFVRKDVYDDNKFDPRYRVSADKDFLLRLYKEGKVFSYLNRPLVYFRVTGASHQPSFRAVLDRYSIQKKFYSKTKSMIFLILDFISYFNEQIYSCKKKFKN